MMSIYLLLYKWNNDPDVVYWADSGNFDICTKEDVRGIYRYVSEKAFCFLMIYGDNPIGDCWVQEMKEAGKLPLKTALLNPANKMLSIVTERNLSISI